nr:helix-turn-helix domain-containing protein [Mesorhizobium sp. CO1-1-8]
MSRVRSEIPPVKHPVAFYSQVDVHISQLRKLLKRHSRKTTIRTVRLAGYALRQRAR